jgi:hypothetical protein
MIATHARVRCRVYNFPLGRENGQIMAAYIFTLTFLCWQPASLVASFAAASGNFAKGDDLALTKKNALTSLSKATALLAVDAGHEENFDSAGKGLAILKERLNGSVPRRLTRYNHNRHIGLRAFRRRL